MEGLRTGIEKKHKRQDNHRECNLHPVDTAQTGEANVTFGSLPHTSQSFIAS